MAKAGDIVYSLGSIIIGSDGSCRIRVETDVLGKGGARHASHTHNVALVPSPELIQQIATLRAMIAASIGAAPPDVLVDAEEVPAQTSEERHAARLARREARRP